MFRGLADVRFEVPAAFAFLTISTEDFNGREPLKFVFASSGSTMVGGGDLGDIE